MEAVYLCETSVLAHPTTLPHVMDELKMNSFISYPSDLWHYYPEDGGSANLLAILGTLVFAQQIPPFYIHEERIITCFIFRYLDL
jgi:hypothetical protein